MTFEVGNTYKTAGVGLVRVVHKDHNGGLLVVMLEPQAPAKCTWLYPDGKLHADKSYSPFNLVPEKKSLTGIIVVLQAKSSPKQPHFLSVVKDEVALVRIQKHFDVLAKQTVELGWEA